MYSDHSDLQCHSGVDVMGIWFIINKKIPQQPSDATILICFSFSKAIMCLGNSDRSYPFLTGKIWRFPETVPHGSPIAGWLISWRIHLKMDDLGVPPWLWKPPFMLWRKARLLGVQLWSIPQKKWTCWQFGRRIQREIWHHLFGPIKN